MTHLGSGQLVHVWLSYLGGPFSDTFKQMFDFRLVSAFPIYFVFEHAIYFLTHFFLTVSFSPCMSSSSMEALFFIASVVSLQDLACFC